MKKVLFVSMLLCGMYAQAMNSQDNRALEELVLFGKIITSCLICVRDCNNANPAHTTQSCISSTAASCSSRASKCSIIPTCCCLSPVCDDSFDESVYERSSLQDAQEHIYERPSGNYSPIFHSHHNIYSAPRSLKD